MKRGISNQILVGVFLFFLPTVIHSQENFEVNLGADLVSGYIWRGQDCGGISVQPGITIAKSGFFLTSWGSIGLESHDTKELDFTLGYENKGFTIAVTDYYFDNKKYFKYSAHSTSHLYEATVGYDFGLLALCWNTVFAGNDYEKANEKRAYSSYFEISAPFRIGGINFIAEIGGTPWEGAYTDGSDKFAIVNIGLGATKEIKITNSFIVPAFAKLTFNPRTEGAYFVFGISL